MKDRKELSYANIKDLTQAEKNKLSDYELNVCDKCGQVESTYDLIWIDFIEEDEAETLKKEIFNYTAVCLRCYNNKFKKV